MIFSLHSISYSSSTIECSASFQGPDQRTTPLNIIMTQPKVNETTFEVNIRNFYPNSNQRNHRLYISHCVRHRTMLSMVAFITIFLQRTIHIGTSNSTYSVLGIYYRNNADIEERIHLHQHTLGAEILHPYLLSTCKCKTHMSIVVHIICYKGSKKCTLHLNTYKNKGHVISQFGFKVLQIDPSQEKMLKHR